MILSQQLLLTILQKSIKIAVIAVSGWLIQRVVIFSLKKFRGRVKKSKLETVTQAKQRVTTITSLMISTTKIAVNFTVLLLVLSELGFNLLPIITGVGILGLAVGMGAKDLASDLISGFFILLENQFNIGDQLKVSGAEGKVVKISLRTVTLREKGGNLHIIPNSAMKIITKISRKK
ncbi:MAG: mechanosensitive ion channel domain-containing protein [Patescibacteria group bacterium]|nr:mechanosensitive ion channel family protein [Patescibacteria group bacterium]